ncbi:MAG: YggT family protein [Advenella sp.]
MISSILTFLISTVFSLLISVFLLRAWMYWVRIHPFTQYARLINTITDWAVVPLRTILPTGNKIDSASLLMAFICAAVELLLMMSVSGFGFADGLLLRLPVVALLMTVKWALSLATWLCIFQAILSWINPMQPVMPVLNTLLAPLLDPIRRFMPRTGMIDFSPLVLILILQVLQIALASLMPF